MRTKARRMRDVPIHKPCFGRAADLQRLAARVSRRGVTFVMAPPRIGKTWLVRNLAFEWAARRKWSVGYAESSSGKNDLLREVVADLYKRWLDGSGVVEQCRSLRQRHRGALIGKVGGTVGMMLGKIAELATGDLTGAHKLIDETFGALMQADQDLRTGGLSLAPITYEDAHGLVHVLAKLTSRPILMVMDAWERGAMLAGDQGSIQKLLDNLNDWPKDFHLVVVIRDLPKHRPEIEFADECCRTHPTATACPVGQLTLDNLEEQDRLLHYLGDKVPAVRDADRNWVLEQCTNPAVIEWWLRRQPPSREALEAEAQNARNERYAGLTELIEQARKDDDRLFPAVVRLALLPEITSAEAWRAYRDVVDPETPDATIADLQSRRILDTKRTDFPSFGHTTAHDAVRTSLLKEPLSASQPDVRPKVRAILKDLISTLAGCIQTLSEKEIPFGAALAALGDTIAAIGLDARWRWPSRLARALLGQHLSAEECDELLGISKALSVEQPSVVALLNGAMFNTLNHAKQEEDRPRRDALLNELRNSTQRHPDDLAVRECFAKAVFNTFCDAKQEEDLPRRDALLEESRSLTRRYADHSVLREWFAKAVFNTLNDAKQEEDLPRRDALLDELQSLAQQHPDDILVREMLSRGLINAINHAKQEKDLSRSDILLDELRTLAQQYLDDPAMREQLAMGLFNALWHAKQEGDLARCDARLYELRTFTEQHPNDPAVREPLARALVTAHDHAKQEGDLPRCDDLLYELRTLAQQHPDDTAVRKQLAKGLFNALNDGKQEENLPRRDALLDELRSLAHQHSDEPALRELLAIGLFNALCHAKQEEDIPRRDALLDELRSFAKQHPDDPAVREHFANGLFNTLIDTSQEGLFGELRAVIREYPDDEKLQDLMNRLR